MVDLNGKMKEHEGVALLPFIDGKRVRDVVATIPLSAGESRLNSFTEDLFIKRYRIPA